MGADFTLPKPDPESIAGFGKLWLKTKANDRKIPSLHFIVSKSADGFDSFCLELAINGFSHTLDESVGNMIKGIVEQINSTTDSELVNLFSEDFCPNHWGLYRSLNANAIINGSPIDEITKRQDLYKVLESMVDLLETIDIDPLSELVLLKDAA